MFCKMVCLLYCAFMYYDRNTPNEGGRGAGLVAKKHNFNLNKCVK